MRAAASCMQRKLVRGSVMNSGIYKITINGKSYVGRATDLMSRKRWHRNKLKNGTHSNEYLQNAYNKYGEFHHEVLEETPYWLGEKEVMWIERLNTYKGDGYNLTIGGEGNAGEANPMFGKKRPDLAERNRRNSGENSPMFGKTGVNTGRKWSDEVNDKKANFPFAVVKDAVLRNGSFRAADKELGINPGTIWARFKRRGIGIIREGNKDSKIIGFKERE